LAISRLRGVGLARGFQPRPVVHHEPGCLELGGRLRQLKLDRLKSRSSCELLALFAYLSVA